ncbi:MAG: stage 0 sporulation protein, partial [Mahellales bacterium]
CCLKYEQDMYECIRKKMPKANSQVETPNGVGVVLETNCLRELVKVKLESEDDEIVIKEFHIDKIRPISTTNQDDDDDLDAEISEEIKSMLDE